MVSRSTTRQQRPHPRAVPPADGRLLQVLRECYARGIRFPLALAVRDLEHSIGPDVNGIACTKIDSASHVRLLDELVTTAPPKDREVEADRARERAFVVSSPLIHN
mgnify:CR=1 FL=1